MAGARPHGGPGSGRSEPWRRAGPWRGTPAAVVGVGPQPTWQRGPGPASWLLIGAAWADLRWPVPTALQQPRKNAAGQGHGGVCGVVRGRAAPG